MALVNCLTDRGRKIMELANAAEGAAELTGDGPAYQAISTLAEAVRQLVMNEEPLWEKRDERDVPLVDV